MRKKGRIYQLAIALLLCFLQMAGIAMYGQDRPRAASKRAQRHQTDTLNTVVNGTASLLPTVLQPKTSGRCWK